MSVEQIEHELAQAERAREEGNEGRARVCARRTAGWAIRAWYQRRGVAPWSGDALTQLKRLQADEAAPQPVRAAAVRLTTQVDLNHALPFVEDAIEDARLILGHTSHA